MELYNDNDAIFPVNIILVCVNTLYNNLIPANVQQNIQK